MPVGRGATCMCVVLCCPDSWWWHGRGPDSSSRGLCNLPLGSSRRKSKFRPGTSARSPSNEHAKQARPSQLLTHYYYLAHTCVQQLTHTATLMAEDAEMVPKVDEFTGKRCRMLPTHCQWPKPKNIVPPNMPPDFGVLTTISRSFSVVHGVMLQTAPTQWRTMQTQSARRFISR